uniref:Uncharacterized protein n=1 Tax=Tanacetum cinerariifolium TaxID=118510 RepID=A0A6L2KY28_TANCI|nr:hypothetical protein [Tanacetum cinerariifolium]
MKAAKYDNIEGIEDMVMKLWSPVKERIIAVTHVKEMKWYGYGNLEEIIVRREDQTLHKFKEGDFPRLNQRDIKDLLLLSVQKKLFNLEKDIILDLNVELRMFTRRIIILKHVEDPQLGVESYQKKLNITKPETFRFDISKMTPYTAYKNPKGIIYQDKLKRNRLMCSDELYKFCNGTLTSVRRALYDVASNLRIWKSLLEGENTEIASGYLNGQYDFVILCPSLYQVAADDWYEVAEVAGQLANGSVTHAQGGEMSDEDEPLETYKSEIDLLIRESMDTFLTGDEEIKLNSHEDIDDLVPILRASEKPLDSLDPISKTFDMTITNPLFNFNSKFTLNSDNPIFDIQDEESDESETETIMDEVQIHSSQSTAQSLPLYGKLTFDLTMPKPILTFSHFQMRCGGGVSGDGGTAGRRWWLARVGGGREFKPGYGQVLQFPPLHVGDTWMLRRPTQVVAVDDWYEVTEVAGRLANGSVTRVQGDEMVERIKRLLSAAEVTATAEEKQDRRNEMKTKGTLLMALPNKDQLKFYSYQHAKLLMKAIEKRYRGNKESKKVQRTLLKQQYENFTSSSETLDQTFDRLQKLISQLELIGEVIQQEDMNIKLLKSLPFDWKTHALIWRSKVELETISLDDLYNNLKIYEPKISGSSNTNQNLQNMAFVSLKSTSSTNEADTTVSGVSTAHTQGTTINSTSIDNLNDAIICAFLASQLNTP